MAEGKSRSVPGKVNPEDTKVCWQMYVVPDKRDHLPDRKAEFKDLSKVAGKFTSEANAEPIAGTTNRPIAPCRESVIITVCNREMPMASGPWIGRLRALKPSPISNPRS